MAMGCPHQFRPRAPSRTYVVFRANPATWEPRDGTTLGTVTAPSWAAARQVAHGSVWAQRGSPAALLRVRVASRRGTRMLLKALAADGARQLRADRE
ncbi:hypothetical protein rosag_48080 [Roseisolibacter agri]|uniref:Uncharacterized protein n=1 Tax=Roseisolibacter agri TaxID=2014610 RepID=A0AA37Q822_9BACT|nr:hypothetical protein rosag_48080 [Roseisolibacter agri]